MLPIVLILIWIASFLIGFKFLKLTKMNTPYSNKEIISRALISGLFFSPCVVFLGFALLPLPAFLLFILGLFNLPDILTSSIKLHSVLEFVFGVLTPYILCSALFGLLFWRANINKTP